MTKKQEFMDQFRKLLVRTYASALLEFSDQKISYIPDDGGVQAKTAKVLQKIEIGAGEPMLISQSSITVKLIGRFSMFQ